MGVITYTAKRAVIGSHTAGNSYQIETDFEVIDRSVDPDGTERRMIDVVTVEYELNGELELLSLLSDVVAESNLPTWEEFLRSTHSRELFQIDLTGTIASPGTDLNVIRYGRGGYNPKRTQAGVPSYRFPLVVQVLS